MSSQNSHSISNLVTVALSNPERSVIAQMLEQVAQHANAYGCILWQALPGVDHKSLQSARLVVLAEWFHGPGGTWIYEMPFSSVTGKAILSQTPVSIDNIWDEKSGVFVEDPFLKMAGIVSMCSIPVRFSVRMPGQHHNNVIEGAVNLYRNTNVPFTAPELAQIEELVSVVPTLHRSIWDGVGCRLIGGVNDLIGIAEGRPQRIALSKANMTLVLRKLCKLVTESLRSIETSVFLEDRMKTPGSLELIATTWKGRLKKTIFAKDSEGLLGWVAVNARPVKILDLASFERDRKRYYDAEYKGIRYIDSDTIDIASLREVLGLRPYARLPRLSFMATPIMLGNEVGGLIRCSIAREAPYYFSELELKLLEQVAAHISRYWTVWMERGKLRDEVHSWRVFAERFRELDAFVRKELRSEHGLSETRIFEEALKNTKPIIQGAEIMDVRSRDEKNNRLHFSATHGRAWEEGDAADIKERRNKTYKLDGSQKSLGARVFNSGVAEVIEDVQLDTDYSETFPRTRRIIVAPIKVAEKVYGVLDIRGTEDRRFPEHALAVGELLGQQLGLYCLLVETVRQIRNTKNELEDSLERRRGLQNQQRQVLEDLNHQLYGPITEAHGRAQDILREEWREIDEHLADRELAERFEDNLLALRGLCGKTKRVTMSTGLFADLEIQESDERKLELLQEKLKLKLIVREPESTRNPHDIVKKLILAARDSQALIDPENNIRFWVEKNTFDVLESNDFFVDYDMLEQMIVNLLDNAFKYAHPNTRILIEGGLTKTDRFYITFTNTGIPIKKKDLEACKQRAWRGEKARQATGEGSGIGLWIVDNIMRAHKGQLIISCDVQDENTGLTKVRLLFSELEVERIPNSDLYKLVD